MTGAMMTNPAVLGRLAWMQGPGSYNSKSTHVNPP